MVLKTDKADILQQFKQEETCIQGSRAGAYSYILQLQIVMEIALLLPTLLCTLC